MSVYLLCMCVVLLYDWSVDYPQSMIEAVFSARILDLETHSRQENFAGYFATSA